MSDHAIKVTIGDGGPAAAEFVCNADEYADCHYYCPFSSCEEGCIYRQSHRPAYVHDKRCGLIVWLEEGGTWDEQYEGPPADVHSGPIELIWHGDYYAWRYAEATA